MGPSQEISVGLKCILIWDQIFSVEDTVGLEIYDVGDG